MWGNNLANKLVVTLLVGVFFAINPYLYDYFELPKVLAFLFVLCLSGFLYTLLQLSKKKPVLFQPKLAVLGLSFLVVAGVSSLLAETPRSFWGQPYRYQGLLFFMGLSFFAFLISQHKKVGLSLQTLQKTIVYSGIAQVILIVVQGFLHALKLPIYTFEGRMTGLIGNPNFAASFLVLSYIYLFFALQKKKIWLSILTFLWLVAILLTDSRGGVLGFGILLIYFLLGALKRKLAFLLVIPMFILAIYFFPQRQPSHFDSRDIIWQKGIQAFMDKPILGWGLENFAASFQAQVTREEFDLPNIRVDKAHNEFLEMAVTTGSIGVLLYMAVLGYASWLLWKQKNHDEAHQQFLVVIMFVVLAQLNVVSITQYIFLFIALGFAMVKQKRV